MRKFRVLCLLACFGGCSPPGPVTQNPAGPLENRQEETAPANQANFSQPRFVEIVQNSAGNGDIQGAIAELRRASEIPEHRGLALSMLGELLIKTGDANNAVPVLRAAISANPTNPNPRRILAAWYYDIGAMDDALAELEEISKIAVTDPRPWRMRGLILKDFERFTEAVNAYQESIKRELPESLRSEVYLELADCLLKLREPSKAKDLLPNLAPSVETKLIEIECLLAEGDIERSLQLLAQVQSVAPNNTRAMKLRADVALEEGDSATAIENLESAARLEPFEYDIRAQLMTAYARVGQTEKAKVLKDEMESLRERRLEFTKLHHRARTEPNSAAVRLELGRLAKELGKIELARTWFRAASILDPNDSSALRELKDLDKNADHP